jgi:hypothetical protein
MQLSDLLTQAAYFLRHGDETAKEVRHTAITVGYYCRAYAGCPIGEG